MDEIDDWRLTNVNSMHKISFQLTQITQKWLKNDSKMTQKWLKLLDAADYLEIIWAWMAYVMWKSRERNHVQRAFWSNVVQLIHYLWGKRLDRRFTWNNWGLWNVIRITSSDCQLKNPETLLKFIFFVCGARWLQMTRLKTSTSQKASQKVAWRRRDQGPNHKSNII